MLKGVTFSLKKAVVTGFLGTNGAGKTTAMKCLLGLAFPDSGEIKYFGGQDLSLKVKDKVGFLPERPYFYDYLTGFEFLKFYGQLSGQFNKALELRQRIFELLKSVDLFHAKDKFIREYSKGMLQKIGFAQALIHRPELVVLDEPMSGLDPDGRYYLKELIKKEASKNETSVFFSSHLLNDAETLCDELVIFKNGKVVFDNTTDSFIENIENQVRLSYQNASGLKHIIVQKDLLQSKIDELRAQKKNIVSIETDKMNLEKAFINITLKKDSEKGV